MPIVFSSGEELRVWAWGLRQWSRLPPGLLEPHRIRTFSTEALRKLSVLGGDVITFRKKDVPLSLKTPSVRLFRSQRIIQILNSGLGLCQCFQCFPQTEENHPHFNRAWRRDCDYTPPPRVYTDAGLNLWSGKCCLLQSNSAAASLWTTWSEPVSQFEGYSLKLFVLIKISYLN